MFVNSYFAPKMQIVKVKHDFHCRKCHMHLVMASIDVVTIMEFFFQIDQTQHGLEFQFPEKKNYYFFNNFISNPKRIFKSK